LATAECDAGGAAALFLLGEDRAAYLYAARWGRSRGSASAVVWRAQEELSARSFSELLLGGGLTTADDDPLLRFKASLADIAAPLLLAGRAFDSAAHARAVEVGRARPLPNGSAAPH